MSDDQPSLMPLPEQRDPNARAKAAGDTFEADFVLLVDRPLSLAISRDGSRDTGGRNMCWLAKSRINWRIEGTKVHVQMPLTHAREKGLME